MNPIDSESDSMGQEDQDELAHSDQDSPGIAAKKARLRAKQQQQGPDTNQVKRRMSNDLKQFRDNISRYKQAGAEGTWGKNGAPGSSVVDRMSDAAKNADAAQSRMDANGDTLGMARMGMIPASAGAQAPGALQKPFRTSNAKQPSPMGTETTTLGNDSYASDPVDVLARARQAPDMTRVAPNGQTGGSLATNAIGTADLLKKLVSVLKPKKAGAETPDSLPVPGSAAKLAPMKITAPSDGFEADNAVRKAMRSNPDALRRFRERLKHGGDN